MFNEGNYQGVQKKMSEFTCHRCGDCCGLVPFNKSEYKAVRRTAKNMGITLVKTEIVIGQHGYLPRALARLFELPPEKINPEKIVCPFLGKDAEGKHICRIYDLRPEVCKLFGVHPEQSPRLVCRRQKINEGEKND